MLKYVNIINEETGLVAIGSGDNVQKYIEMGMIELDVQQSDIDNQWYMIDKCPMKTEEQKAQEERERISHLKLTKRVFALALQQFGVTYTQLKELIATDEQAQLEWDLCVELERSNPLLDIMAGKMGVVPIQLDYIFQKANGEDVQPPVKITINPIPETATVLINDNETREMVLAYGSDVNYEVSAEGYATTTGEKLEIIENTVIEVELVAIPQPTEAPVESEPTEDIPAEGQEPEAVDSIADEAMDDTKIENNEVE